MRHLNNIMTNDRKHCYLCGSSEWIEWHHIFNGPFRSKSTMYGLVVPLCHYCHNEPPNGVHYNYENNLKLKKEAQKRFMECYPELEFMEIFHKNYL